MRVVVGVLAAVALLALPPPAAAEDGWVWPAEGAVLTPYSNDNSQPYAGGMHRGIDIGAGVGARVVAARAGTVTHAGAVGSSGLTVSVRTADGRHLTSYLHLSAIDVREGEPVAAGARIGAVGTTGRRSVEEPHLHFGVRLTQPAGHYVDPLSAAATRCDAGHASSARPHDGARAGSAGAGAGRGAGQGAARPARTSAGPPANAPGGRLPAWSGCGRPRGARGRAAAGRWPRAGCASPTAGAGPGPGTSPGPANSRRAAASRGAHRPTWGSRARPGAGRPGRDRAGAVRRRGLARDRASECERERGGRQGGSVDPRCCVLGATAPRPQHACLPSVAMTTTTTQP